MTAPTADADGWCRVFCLRLPLIRVSVAPDEGNGLNKPSQVMVDKAMTVKRERLGPVFGVAGAAAMIEVERSLAVFLGIAK